MNSKAYVSLARNYSIIVVIAVLLGVDKSSDYLETNDTLAKARQALAANLVASFAELDEVWRKRVDPLMEKFKETEPSFYNEYQSARVVVDASGTREGKTTDAGGMGTGVAKAAS